MARKARGRPAGIEYDFIPKSFGNDKDKDPIIVRINPPTEKQRRVILSYVHPSGNDERTVCGRMELASENHATKVTSYLASDESKITSGEEMSEHGEIQILAEIYDEVIESTSWEEESKKVS